MISEIEHIKPKLSPKYTNPVHLQTTVGLVQAINFDSYLEIHISNGYMQVDLCTANGTSIIPLANANPVNGWCTIWTPLVKKGSYIKIITNQGTTPELRLVPAAGGVSNV